MRIAIAADGTRGDVHPLLALAASLARRGHDVRFCGPPDFAADAAARGVAYRAVGTSVRGYLEANAGAIHGRALTAVREGQRYMLAYLAQSFRELDAAIGEVDLVLAGGVQMAASSLAERRGARFRMVVYCPSLLRSPQQTPFAVPRGELPRWANRAAWRLVELFVGATLGRALDRERARLGLPPARDLYALLFGTRPALAAEPRLAPPPPDLAGGVLPLGCLHPFEPGPLDPKLEAFLAAGEPPVYVGFGSMTDPDPARSTRLVLDALERAGVRAVLSQGWAGLGAEGLPESVYAVGPVSHAALFPRMAAVVHHGGAGTTTTAARAGVPQLLVPHLIDQYHWAHRVERLGLGPPALPRRRLDAVDLAERLLALRDNELLAERCAAFGAALRDDLARRPDPAELVVA